MSLLSSKTSLKSLKYSDFIQSQKLESPTDLKAFSNTDASVGQHRSPDTKSGLGLQIEKRKEDVIRLGKATVNSPQAIRFQTNQALLNQSGTINKILRGDELSEEDRKEVAIGAARVAGVTASAIAQAAGSGTGLRVLQGFVPLNGGYVVDKGKFGLLGAAVASLNPFGTGDNQISKANLALRGTVVNDGFIGSSEFDKFLSSDDDKQSVRGERTSQALSSGSFSTKNFLDSDIIKTPIAGKLGNFVTGSFSDTSVQSNFSLVPSGSKEAKKNGSFSNIDPKSSQFSTTTSPTVFYTDPYNTSTRILPQTSIFFDAGNNKPIKFIASGSVPTKGINRQTRTSAGTRSLESRFYASANNKTGTAGQDRLNVLSFETVALGNDTQIKDQDIIPFTIQNLPANTTNSEFLYFRAYLDSMSDSYSGEWSGTRYIGRAEELYNYTGFKRGLQFSFKIAAHSPQELKPLYEKLNRLVGTTAPTYQDGLFMQGVFSKITIGDYVQKLPGFFTSVGLTWQTTYPWEIGDVDSGAAIDNNIPRVPHILDVSVSFQPVHDFAPQYNKTFIGFSPDTVIGQAS